MNDIVIATNTFYPTIPGNEVRIALSKKTLQKALSFGYIIKLVDGGSAQSVIEEYQALGIEVHLQAKPGMGNGRRQAIRLAAEASTKAVVWMEPEKEPFVQHISFLVDQLEQQNADIIIPKRASLSSYPFLQQQTEILGNLFWKEVTDTDLDMYFGPRVLKKELSEYFLQYNGDYGDLWDALFVPVMNAIVDGKKVTSIEIDYAHPVEQTREEEHNLDFDRKRFQQLDKISFAVGEHWKKLHE